MRAWISASSSSSGKAPVAAADERGRAGRGRESHPGRKGRARPTGAVVAAVNRALLHPSAKPVAWLLVLLPLAWLLWSAFADTLGPNPAEALIRSGGDWTLRFLCLTLAITPLRELSGLSALARFRRLIGLTTFGYGLLHFLCYAWLDMGLDAAAIVEDIGKRPFILVGSAALLTMLPLALTSFNRAIKALGAARWRHLHRLVYATALLALLHFFWMRAGKNDFDEVAAYAAVVGVLFGWRLLRRWRGRRTPVKA